MINFDETAEYEGLRFFGKINASISHEIRNALAVINENAGLVKDLLLLSEKGYPLDITKISGRVEKVIEQVRRTDAIVDNMNRFAHSADNDFSKVDTIECLDLVIKLSARLANMKGVILKLENLEEKVEITTFPFLLENLLYLCIDNAMENAGEDKMIVMTVNKKGNRIHFRFSGVNLKYNTEKVILSASESIFEKLGARIIVEKESGAFLLDMPEDLKA